MKRWLGFAGIVATSLVLLSQSADAGPLRNKKDDPRLTAVGFGVGGAMTALYFHLRGWGSNGVPKISKAGAGVATTFGCMALSPIVGTVVLGRELTMREAHVMVGDCIIPFIGAYVVNATWDAHPEWERYSRTKR